jgi:hypothetical protein
MYSLEEPVKVAGADGIPDSGVAAVTMNVTDVTPAAAGFVAAHQDGSQRPGTSNLNFKPGRPTPTRSRYR